MSKKTGTPWFRTAKNGWYVWHLGRQHRLATGKENKAEAWARFAALLKEPSEPPTSAPKLTVTALVDAFQLATKVKPSTLTSYAAILNPFAAAFGARPADALTPDDVTAWAGGRKWSQTTRRYALTVIGTACEWAVPKLLAVNPLRDMPKPPGRSRGAEILIPPELHARILSVSSPEFGLFLTAVRETGARPGEVARVTAADVRWDASCWVLAEHKTDRTGRDRVIYVPEGVLAVCRGLAVARPVGPLYRTTRGEPWKKTAWRQAMMRAQRKLKLDRRPMTSGQRHSFATDALASGVPDAVVAELLGHSGTAMISRHYGHLGSKAAVLKAALNQVRPLSVPPPGDDRPEG